jgi:hypothetical protein
MVSATRARAIYWRNQGQLIRELPEGRNCGAEKSRRDPRFTRSLTDANNRELKFIFSVLSRQRACEQRA